MSFGVALLVHQDFDRVEQLVRHWVEGGCPVCIHVDAKTEDAVFEQFKSAVAHMPNVTFVDRVACEWGMWGMVQATQAVSEQLLEQHPEISHVFVASASCLPLRPIAELQAYLNKFPNTDFIESATTSDVPWTVGGLSMERFTLRFPFSWRGQKRLFDAHVRLQRRLKFMRKIPQGIVPHMGSQWWCLTRATLSKILNDPRRAEFDNYFRKVWIPDESYFQTLARLHSTSVESRSLTFSRFDFQGRPHILYDDHLEVLQRSECFVARKVWAGADRLWDTFLAPRPERDAVIEPSSGRIDRLFENAHLRRTQGRPGLYMCSRFPVEGREKGVTAGEYVVFEGFSELLEGFMPWLAATTDMEVHGHLFGPDRAEFSNGGAVAKGALSDNALLRDYNAPAFLKNLLWNTRGTRQCFQFGPADCQDVSWPIAKDRNATIHVISGAWAIPLFHSDERFAVLRARAARLQQIEADHLEALRSPYAQASVRIWSLAEFVEAPQENLLAIAKTIGGRHLNSHDLPQMRSLVGFGQFLQSLKNQGMHPYLMGDFPTGHGKQSTAAPLQPKPYWVS